MSTRLRRLVPAARNGVRGFIDRHWQGRQPADPPPAARPTDLRMVPVAATAWAAAWIATSETMAGFAVVVASVAVGIVVAALRRSALVLSVAIVMTAIAGVGLIDVYRLRHGPVAQLASHEAVVSADLEIRSDPHLVDAGGTTSNAAVMKASTMRIEGRGGSWLVRAPVLVLVSGPQLQKWFEVPVGTRVVVDGRLQSPNPGSDIAAILRVRGSPVVVRPPPAGLRLVEEVRTGLRRSVADRRPEPRALVPALVLGDTSGLDTALTENFTSTGLTHVSLR